MYRPFLLPSVFLIFLFWWGRSHVYSAFLLNISKVLQIALSLNKFWAVHFACCFYFLDGTVSQVITCRSVHCAFNLRQHARDVASHFESLPAYWHMERGIIQRFSVPCWGGMQVKEQELNFKSQTQPWLSLRAVARLKGSSGHKRSRMSLTRQYTISVTSSESKSSKRVLGKLVIVRRHYGTSHS